MVAGGVGEGMLAGMTLGGLGAVGLGLSWSASVGAVATAAYVSAGPLSVLAVEAEYGALSAAPKAANSVATVARQAPIDLGHMEFAGRGGMGLMGDVSQVGHTLIIRNTVVFTSDNILLRGRQLLAAAQQIEQLAQQRGATEVTFEAFFANGELAARFGQANLTNISRTVEANAQAMLRAFQGN
jgi:hypothetical protein